MSDLPSEYLHGIDLFNQEKFFEAHEVWESIWMRSQGETKIFYQALIQAAGALLHMRNGNRQGALHLFAASLDKFSRVPREFLGLPVGEFTGKLSVLLADVRNVAADSRVELLPGKMPKIALPCSR